MSVNESGKESSLSYIITKNLKCLENTAGKAVEKAIELQEKDLPEELSYERMIEWLKQQKSDIEKQVIMLDGIISRANDLDVERKELLCSANDDEWENNVAFYEDYLYEEDCLFDKGTKIYCERASLLTKLNRISEAIIEVKMKCEKIDHEPAAIAEQKKSLENLIEKIIMTSKPPTLNPVEFDGNPRMWSQFISQFEESIHRRTDLAPKQKFMHLSSSLKGAAREQINDLMVNEENYPLALEIW
uniref:Uncharacterized protein n=1 Tax=Loa loa TaxID=7209 RepID=A0A1I7VFU3_LOALO